MFIRNSVIKKCGLFDPRFFMYSEESDMQKTFKKNGYISGIIQGPQIVHLEGKSAPSSKRILMSTSGMFVYQKNGVIRFHIQYTDLCSLYYVSHLPY